jgi:adenylate cyclase
MRDRPGVMNSRIDLTDSTDAPRGLRALLTGRLAGLAGIGVGPDDSEDERLRKATLTLAAMLMASMAIVWVGTYWSLGLWRSGAIPFVYQLATAVGLVWFARTKSFGPFRATQLVLIFALPFLLQASLGGFRTSSAVELWAVTAPLGALLFDGVRRATPWFIAFVVATVVSGALEPSLGGEGRVPTSIVVLFFVLNLLGVSTTVFLLMRYFIGERDRVLRALKVEQDRSERLLLNVLPAPIAQRLKDGEVIADGFESVTVLFADIVGFTPFAQARPPAEVVAVLNQLFSVFDELADRHQLEKIKTIGDAYMVAGGLPLAHADHQRAMAEMGLDMCAAVDRFRSESGIDLAIRVGIDSGPVVAGVIGHRKFSYDVWGDTVNTASRMQTHGRPACIHVTERVYEQLRDRYTFEDRGPVDIKGKGPTPTYLLVGRIAG